MYRPGVGVIQELVEDRWRQPGDADVLIPRWSYNQYGATVKYADNFVFDNHDWRLRNLTLGYTLPKSLTRKALVENLRVYVNSFNTATITSRTGIMKYMDPENSESMFRYYPQMKTFNFGVNLTF